jgi:hypothetical protein
MATPFEKVDIFPGYAAGFTFRWVLSPLFVDPLPWTFVVQMSPEPAVTSASWHAISPVLTNKMLWVDDVRRLINKDEVLYFRIKLTTPKGVHYSDVRTPYGDLPKREWLIAKEIMRKEILQAKKMSGIIGQLWSISTFGPVCTHCKDPITGDILNSACEFCYGTGREPGYHGPYAAWMTFSTAAKDEQMAEDGSGTRQPYSFQIRMVVCPYVKDSDVIVDPCRDKRYYVDAVKMEAEIRRVALVQTLTVHEAPNSEPIYKLGIP